jgi:hypothetical protein
MRFTVILDVAARFFICRGTTCRDGYDRPAFFDDKIIIKANLSTQTDTTTTWNRKTVEESFTQEIAVLLPHYLDGVMQLGYSSERIIFWANFNFSLNWYNQRRLYTAENDQIYGLLYFGYRFDAPGLAGKTMDWLYGKQP